MPLCTYCGNAYSTSAAHCASCGAPKPVEELERLREAEKLNAWSRAQQPVKVVIERAKGSGMPRWAWIVLAVVFAPILLPFALVFLFMIVSYAWWVILIIGGIAGTVWFLRAMGEGDG